MPKLHISEWEIEEIQAGIDEIRKDRAVGARKLAVRAAALLMQCAEQAPADVPRLARAIMAAQPAMSPLLNLAWGALSNSDVAASCERFLESMERNAARVEEAGADLIGDGAVVMTHSFSSTVLATLRRASRRGRRFRVICPESRPVCEGVAMAASLGMAAIDSCVIADAAIFRFLPEASLVLVGADSVSGRGIYNKTGTALLALAARDFGLKVYALCPTDRFLPPSYEPPAEEPRDPRELLERELPHVTAANYSFDVTPLQYLTGVVTEKGILPPQEVRDRLLGVHPCERALVGPVQPRDTALVAFDASWAAGMATA